MRQDTSSETLLKPATLYFARDDEEADVAVADHRDITRSGVSRTVLHLAYVNPDAVEMTPKKASDCQTMWSKVLKFVAQGFALSRVSLHPVDDFLRDDRWSEARSGPREIISSNEQRVSAMFSVPPTVAAPKWNWWASSCEVATAIGAHLRKERDIKRAVDALSKLDDKTLQDIGIPHRSRIEDVVRYCHDC